MFCSGAFFFAYWLLFLTVKSSSTANAPTVIVVT